MNKSGHYYNVFFIKLGIWFFLLGAGCTSSVKKEEVDENSIRIIEVKNNLSNTKVIKLSDVASNIEYCPLETGDHCLVRYPGMKVYVSKDFIVTIGNQTLNVSPVYFVFNRKTGQFIREISKHGQGPNEYTDAIESFWDKENEQVCMSKGMTNCFYNLDGTLSHKIDFIPGVTMGNPSFVYKDYYIRYFQGVPRVKRIRPRIAFYDKNGFMIDSIPEYRLVNNINGPYTTYPGSGKFYVFQDSLYYKDIFCDTLYNITDFTLQPRYIFNTGGLAIPYEIQAEGQYDDRRGDNLWDKYFIINKINESSKHLYFTIEHRQQIFPAIYEKSQNKLQIMNPVTKPATSQWRNMIGDLKYGFENDLNGGLPFWPQQMVSDNEMMCVYTAAELLEMDASKVTDPKLKKLLNSLKDDDNPVIAIVTLKD